MGAACALVALGIGPHLPFLNKAFHIDDAFMLRVVENVLADPRRPFAGTFDYFGRVMLLPDITTNPPGIAYWLAPVAAWAGESEVALHVTMLVFPLLLALSIAWLARRFGASWGWAAAFAATSPATIVGLNVMQDVPAAALGAAALAAFVRGVDLRHPASCAAGAMLAGAAMLVKYSAVAIVPVLALYALLHGRPRALAWTLLPVCVLGAWGLHGWLLNGLPHFLAVSQRSYGLGSAWRANLAALPVLIGAGCWLAPALLAAAAWRRDAAILVLVRGSARRAGARREPGRAAARRAARAVVRVGRPSAGRGVRTRGARRAERDP